MGQGGSVPQASIEELSKRLTSLFASKCYSRLELYNYRAVFRTLASKESGVHFWDESTLCKFLELPDAIMVGPVVFQMASNLGAFPFPSQAPAILSEGAMLKVVTILTERHKRVLKRGKRDWWRELYRSLAVYDKQAQAEQSPTGAVPGTEEAEGAKAAENEQGFAIDKPAGQDDGEADDDELLLAAFETMDAVDTFKLGEKSSSQHSIIPSDNFLRLIQLLLLIAPLEPQEPLNIYGAKLDSERLAELRAVANNIVSSFAVDKNPGVTYKNFDAVIASSMPFLFSGLSPLFEHYLFDKGFDLSKRKDSTTSQTGPPSPTQTRPSMDFSARRMSSSASSVPKRRTSISMGQFGQLHDTGDNSPVVTSPTIEEKAAPPIPPLLPHSGDILNLSVLSQLSFFIKGPSTLFRHMQPLYSGNSLGFSLGSFEKSVFKWQSPSILLVSGTLLPSKLTSPRAKTFVESLPPKRLPTSTGPAPSDENDVRRVTYGAYIPAPWKATPKSSITSDQALLFQLGPHHAVFKASASNLAADHVYFCKPPAVFTGVGFGSPVASAGSSSAATSGSSGLRLARRASWLGDTHYPIGPVSLHFDDGLEFGVFTHLSTGGGAYLPSDLPRDSGLPAAGDWQDKFEVDAFEVWGCGSSKDVEEQRQAWKWEEAEAERRRRINLGTGDQEMDRELLKMAGIISDAGRSGGSMG